MMKTLSGIEKILTCLALSGMFLFGCETGVMTTDTESDSVSVSSDNCVNDACDPTDDSAPSGPDAARGEALYMSTGCAACHAADGSGGSGPDIQGVAVQTLDVFLIGLETHVGGKQPDLTDQDLADIAAFLGS